MLAKQYVIERNEKIMANINHKELAQIVLDESLSIYTPVYDLKAQNWRHFKDLLIYKLQSEKYSKLPVTECILPDYTPPKSIEISNIIDEEEYVQSILEISQNDITKSKIELNTITEEKSILEKTIEKLKILLESSELQNKQINESLSKETQINQNLLIKESENKQLETKLKVANKQIEDQNQIIDNQKNEIAENNKTIQNGKIERETIEDDLFSLKIENEKLKKVCWKYKDKLRTLSNGNINEETLKQKILLLNSEIKEISAEFNQEKRKSILLDKNMKKLHKENIEYQKKLQLSNQQIENINHQNSKLSKKEEAQFSGEYYKANTEKKYFVRTSNGEDGPYSIGILLELKKEVKLRADHRIREENSEEWRPVSQIDELNSEFKIVNNNGTKSYYLKRQSQRAPFYETVTISISGKQIKGQCSSISTGGCFIELSKIDSQTMIKDKEIGIIITQGVFQSSMVLEGLIKNISTSRPRGLGIQFKDIDQQSKSLITEYIAQYLKANISKKAA